MKRRNQNTRNLIVVILLAIFTAHYTSSTMFGHSHYINGATIVHSHIHNSGHTNNPDAHTQTELTLIDQLTLQTLETPDIITIDTPREVSITSEYRAVITDLVILTYNPNLPARAPPIA